MNTIIIEEREHDFKADLISPNGVFLGFGCGDSPEEAIGVLIRSCSEFLSIEIKGL